MNPRHSPIPGATVCWPRVVAALVASWLLSGGCTSADPVEDPEIGTQKGQESSSPAGRSRLD